MTTQGIYTFLPLEKVIHGPGTVDQLPPEIDRLGGRRVLVITGRTLAHETPLVSNLETMLGDRHVATFSGIRQHVPESGIAAAKQLAGETRADLLVSLGGGSPVDGTKAVARAIFDASDQLLPQIALPTTLSAAEFSHMAGFTDEDAGEKTGFVDPRVTPRVVILDPELTLYTPDWLWSASGIRALDHAVETLYSPGLHPINDILALQAIGDLFTYLPQAKQDPRDVEVRHRCQLGAWMSFFGPGTVRYGLSHRLGRIIGASYDVPHGITSAITLAHVMRYKVKTEASRLSPIGRALNLVDGSASAREATLAAADAVSELVKQLELPHRLRDVGVPEGALEDIAKKAAEQMAEDPDGVRAIVEAAW